MRSKRESLKAALEGRLTAHHMTAQAIVAEIGVDMSRFPTSDHLSCWAGMCPGNNESAGKRKSGRTGKANRWLKRCLSQAGWAASHTKNTYLSAQFKQIAKRRGKKRAIIAVGRTIPVIAYHLLAEGTDYQELGADYFDPPQTQSPSEPSPALSDRTRLHRYVEVAGDRSGALRDRPAKRSSAKIFSGRSAP